MKVYRRGAEVLVAACDSELLGRTFRDGEIRLNVGAFYDGDRVTSEVFLSQLAMATMGNFVGRVTVDTARVAGYIEDGCELMVDGVPHAQMVTM